MIRLLLAALPDLAVLCGILLVAAAAALVWLPLAFAWAGAVLIVAGVLGSLRASQGDDGPGRRSTR